MQSEIEYRSGQLYLKHALYRGRHAPYQTYMYIYFIAIEQINIQKNDFFLGTVLKLSLWELLGAATRHCPQRDGAEIVDTDYSGMYTPILIGNWHSQGRGILPAILYAESTPLTEVRCLFESQVSQDKVTLCIVCV